MTDNCRSVSGIILAGGRGRRLGRAKHDLILGVAGGRTVTMLGAVLSEVSQVAGEIVVVGGNVAELPPYVKHTVDRVTGVGPLAGLEAGLAAASGTLVVVTGCDTPFVPARLLAMLAERAHAAYVPGQALAVVPRSRRGIEPLCSVYSQEVGAVVQEVIAAGGRAVSRLLDRIPVLFLEEHEYRDLGTPAELFFNVNTEQELIQARTRWQELHAEDELSGGEGS